MCLFLLFLWRNLIMSEKIRCLELALSFYEHHHDSKTTPNEVVLAAIVFEEFIGNDSSKPCDALE